MFDEVGRVEAMELKNLEVLVMVNSKQATVLIDTRVQAASTVCKLPWTQPELRVAEVNQNTLLLGAQCNDGLLNGGLVQGMASSLCL